MSPLENALKFIENIDALKNTYRKCLIMNGERPESTAEHTFSLAMSVLVLSSFANEKIDVMKTVKMALFHDLAEALLGDTFHYDKEKVVEQGSEAAALRKMLLPIAETQLADEIFVLWNEFEYGHTPEALFLRGVDRFLPMYHNAKTSGHTWVKHGITHELALRKNAHMAQGSTALWEYTQKMLQDAKSRGWLR